MEFLNEIRSYDFEGYDKKAIASTQENIRQFQEDSNIIWELWKEDGLAVNEKFNVDFHFYSPSKEGVSYFSELCFIPKSRSEFKKEKISYFMWITDCLFSNQFSQNL